MSGAAVGAFIGLLVGVALSVYVARLDHRKRLAGVRVRAEYRLSLFGVPAILTLAGALVGGLIAQ